MSNTTDGAIFVKDGITASSRIFGWSKSKIQLMLCTEENEIEISEEFTHESNGVAFNLDVGEIEGYFEYEPLKAKAGSKVSCTIDNDNSLSLLSINVDYVDLRCNFYAISLFENDIYHWLRSDNKKPMRKVYYAGKSKSDENSKPFFNIFKDEDDGNGVIDTSIKSLTKPIQKIESGVLFILNTYQLGFFQDIFFPPLPPENNIPSYLQSSCAYDAINNQIVYYIKGGYSQTSCINENTGELTWIDFESANKTKFIDNHQIAFYFIDLGG